MTNGFNYSEVTSEISKLAELCCNNAIPSELYTEYNVNLGLRDIKGNGVLTGLTNISEVTAKQVVDGVETPMYGKLYYRGILIDDIVKGFISEQRYGYEETAYLLIFGELPTQKQLDDFITMLNLYRSVPPGFTRNFILKAPSSNMMNALARSVLMLYYYDANPEEISIPNKLRQCLQLIAMFPLLAVYGYHAYNHYEKDHSLIIHQSDPSLSTAENILHILRLDQQYTELEARIFDLALVLHAEHGGGNNSTFTIRVVSSTGTDTYSAIAAGIGSLKGAKHGGANMMVMKMMEDIKENVKDWSDEGQVADYLKKLLNKEAFDRSGLIYGFGHAIYSLSDPRAKIFESFVEKLSAFKGFDKEYQLYSTIARLAPELITNERKIYKGVSVNIDFYSGFVYQMLGLPIELFTPIFAIARITGWSAHLIEELVNSSKIIRPAYKCITKPKTYLPIAQR